MDFLTWWFGTHEIWSTILSPFFTILWCIFKEEYSIRMVVAIVLTMFFTYASHR
jgi:hypothetical protein